MAKRYQFGWKKRDRIFERDDHKCGYCGVSGHLCIDHKTPLSRGGGNEDDNLIAACFTCNNKKGVLTYDEFISEIGGEK